MNNKICEFLSDKFIRRLFILFMTINILVLFNIIYLKDIFNICLIFINGVISIWCLKIILKSQNNEYILSMRELQKFLVCNIILLICSFLYTENINVYLIEKFFPVIGIAFLTIGVYKVKLYNSINFRKIKRGFLISTIIYWLLIIVLNYDTLSYYIRDIINDFSYIPRPFISILIVVVLSALFKFILPYLILNWLEKNKDQIIADNKASHE